MQPIAQTRSQFAQSANGAEQRTQFGKQFGNVHLRQSNINQQITAVAIWRDSRRSSSSCVADWVPSFAVEAACRSALVTPANALVTMSGRC